MEGYTTEEEQIENIKRWWSQHGKSILIGLILGLAVLAGVRYWNDQKGTQAEQASVLYEQMMVALEQNNKKAVLDQGAALIGQYPKTPYGALAAFALAKVKLEEGDAKSARTYLQWVLDNAKQPGLEHIARLRLARVSLSENQTDAALKLLDVADTGVFTAEYEELKGDIYAATGKTEQARVAYTKAKGLAKEGTDQRTLQMKLDDLGAAS